MVFEGFPNFRIFENSFLNGSMFTPKWYQQSPQIIQKPCLKTNRFPMSIFHQFWMDSGTLNHPKTRTGMPQVLPGHSWNTSCAPPGPSRLPELDFEWFQLDLGSILEGFGHQNGSQSDSKTYKICLLVSPALSSSSQASASQPPASPVSQRPRRDSRSVNNARGLSPSVVGPCLD